MGIHQCRLPDSSRRRHLVVYEEDHLCQVSKTCLIRSALRHRQGGEGVVVGVSSSICIMVGCRHVIMIIYTTSHPIW